MKLINAGVVAALALAVQAARLPSLQALETHHHSKPALLPRGILNVAEGADFVDRAYEQAFNGLPKLKFKDLPQQRASPQPDRVPYPTALLMRKPPDPPARWLVQRISPAPAQLPEIKGLTNQAPYGKVPSRWTIPQVPDQARVPFGVSQMWKIRMAVPTWSTSVATTASRGDK